MLTLIQKILFWGLGTVLIFLVFVSLMRWLSEKGILFVKQKESEGK